MNSELVELRAAVTEFLNASDRWAFVDARETWTGNYSHSVSSAERLSAGIDYAAARAKLNEIMQRSPQEALFSE